MDEDSKAHAEGRDAFNDTGSRESSSASDQSDTGYAPKSWAFDAEVTRVFDDMLTRSIPQYPAMRDVTRRVGKRFITPNSTVVDLGCSRGESIAQMVSLPNTVGCHFIGVEISPPMLEASRQRFEGSRSIEIIDIDLRRSYPATPSQVSLTTSVLLLQFVPINYRLQILENVFSSLRPGGALLLVEKVLGEGAMIDRVMVEEYHEYKASQGYTREDVVRKSAALEGVLVPVTASMNEKFLHLAGFSEIDCIWRWLNFAAWVAIKK